MKRESELVMVSLRYIWTVVLVLLAPPAFAAPVVSLNVEPFTRQMEQLHQFGACRSCDLRGADLRDAHLIGVDLRDADLRGARLEGANLEGADLSGARLDDALLNGAVLTNTELSGTDLRRADLREAVVINAYSPDVLTEGMQFAGADLTGSHLIYGGAP